MDPTEAELTAMVDLAGVRNWSGVDGQLWDALRVALGDPARVREIVLIQRPVWDTTIQALRVPEDPANPRALTPVEQSKVESFRRVCFLRLGSVPDTVGGAGAAAPTVAVPAVGGNPNASSATRKLKLSATLDPTLEAEVTPLSQTEIGNMYAAYERKYGAMPTPDSDVSPDQLASLSQVLKAGAPPFADFSIFGAYGQRLLRKQTFTAYQLSTATGEWQKREQPGPADYHSWHQCWRVYRTGMLLLEAADAERLDAYGEYIRSFVSQFSDEAWWLVARADHRMRSEQWDRIRRELRSKPEFGYTDASPWSAVLAKALKDTEFWHRELVTPATLWLARPKDTPGKSSRPSAPSSPKQSPRGSPKKKQKGPKRYTGEDKSAKGPDGHYTVNRRGVEICRLYGEGKCGSKAAQGRCKNGRSHQCSLCLGPHMSSECQGKQPGN